MNFKLTNCLAAAGIALFAATPALSAGSHSAAGEPGKAANVDRTVTVKANETADGMARVDPGHQDEVIWQFTKSGTFTFACLIPGHMQAGMVGEVTVVDEQASQ